MLFIYEGKARVDTMSGAAEELRVKNGIIAFNLSLAEEPAAGSRGGESGSGFMSECYLGRQRGPGFNGRGNSEHIHFREYR